MTADTLGDALPREMTRVRDEVMPAYVEIGPAGSVALAMMRRALDAAQRALAEGDVVAMARAYEDLRGFTLLARYGASHFGYMSTPEGAELVFQVKGVRVRLNVKFPPASQFARTPTGRMRHGGSAAQEQAREAEVRRIWRSLALVIKSKLEAVSSGISTFDREFLADIVTGNGRTIGEVILPRLAEAIEGGRLLPAAGETSRT